jgi:hypothetical protein
MEGAELTCSELTCLDRLFHSNFRDKMDKRHRNKLMFFQRAGHIRMDPSPNTAFGKTVVRCVLYKKLGVYDAPIFIL